MNDSFMRRIPEGRWLDFDAVEVARQEVGQTTSCRAALFPAAPVACPFGINDDPGAR